MGKLSRKILTYIIIFLDYESRGKTFTVLCEIATEACQTWFPSQEKK